MTYREDRIQLVHGACEDVLPQYADRTFSSMITDPPSGTDFLGFEWDSSRGGRQQWTTWLTPILTEARRVLKPGAFAAVWAGGRTLHWTMTALEDAGFDIRQVITHHYSHGTPKGTVADKDIDRMLGTYNQREVVGRKVSLGARKPRRTIAFGHWDINTQVTAPAHELARQWEDYRIDLRPTTSFWVLARTPLAARTVAKNLLEYEAGALNIGANRLGGMRMEAGGEIGERLYPSDTIFTHHPACELVGIRSIRGRMFDGKTTGIAEPEEWLCHPDCPYAVFTDQVESRPGAKGFPLFFYVTKADLDLRCAYLPAQDQVMPLTEALSYLSNRQQVSLSRFKAMYAEAIKRGQKVEAVIHPTQKPLELIRWLVRLLTPPGGRVLDVFCGTGTTLRACMWEGRKGVGIEKLEPYCKIANYLMDIEQRKFDNSLAGAASLLDIKEESSA